MGGKYLKSEMIFSIDMFNLMNVCPIYFNSCRDIGTHMVWTMI